MQYEIHIEAFNGRYEMPKAICAAHDREAVGVALRQAKPCTVLEVWQGERLVARLQPEDLLASDPGLAIGAPPLRKVAA